MGKFNFFTKWVKFYGAYCSRRSVIMAIRTPVVSWAPNLYRITSKVSRLVGIHKENSLVALKALG